MAVTPTPIYAQAPINASFQSTTAAATVFTAGAQGGRIHVFSCCNTTTGAVDLTVYLGGLAASNQVSVVSIPASAGNANNVPAVDVLRSTQIPALSYDAYGNKVIDLAAAGVLGVKASSTGVVMVHIEGGSF